MKRGKKSTFYFFHIPAPGLTEASDIEDADVVRRGREGDGLVDALHDVVEEPTVHRLGQGVARPRRLPHLQRDPGGDDTFNQGEKRKKQTVILN